jgi:hypothetical protein
VYFISIVPTGLKNTTNKVCFLLVSFANFIPALPVMFESQFFGGWSDGGAKAVIREAPKRLKQNGWKKTRGAIAVTIRYGYMVILWWDTLTLGIPRAWIICGLCATSTQKFMLAVEYHSRAVEVLDWGSHVWQDVPTEDRGCVFERTFVRGEKRLYIMAIHEVSNHVRNFRLLL